MDSDTYSLFEEKEFGAEKRSKDLKISATHKKPLSRNQQTFNRLTKRIEQLQVRIKADSAKLEALLKVYLAEIPEKKTTVARARISVAKALGNSAKTIKYGKRQYEHVREVIRCLCEEAFSDIEPDEETERFYDSWSASSYREVLREQRDFTKQMIAEQAKHAFGMNIDPDEIDDTPEGFARFAKRLQEELAGKEAGQGVKRRMSKKQREREELRKQEEALTLKSMRNIYLSLAKALHPDTTTDSAEKARKEELMKKVTAAYAEKDLPALLKLEMEWVASENAALDTLPEDTLKLYIASLKEQAAALEQEHNALHYHPRFACLSEFSRYPEAAARQFILDQAHDYTRVTGGFNEIMAVFDKPAPKKEYLAFVDEYRGIMNARPRFSDAFMTDVF